MSIGAHCGSCTRELLLGQLLQPSDGFRCPFCGFALAPAYATVAPAVAARVMVARAALVTALAEANEPGLARRHRPHWWARSAATQPTQTIPHQ